MRKILLISGILLSILVGIILVIIFMFMNPDHLKPLITTQFEKNTNCEITLDDHLAFSFFPYFGVRAQHIRIAIPKHSPTINLVISNAVAQLKLIPLLHGKIATGSIQIDELNFLQSAPLFSLKFNNVKLKISSIEKFNHVFETVLSFNFTDNHFPRSEKVVILGNAIIDYEHQTAAWKNIHASLADIHLTGDLYAKNIFENPDIAGHFTLESQNLKKFLTQVNLFEIAAENIPDVAGVNADLDLLANNESFCVQSILHMKKIQTAKFNIDDINAKLNFKNNVLNLESGNAYIYGGYVSAEASINLNSYSPATTAHIKTFNIQIEPLFKLLQTAHTAIYPDSNMSGSGNFEIEISTSGTEMRSLLNNLNGSAKLSISNGLLMGKNWDEIATRLIPFNQTNTNDTGLQGMRIFRFKQLTASFKINNGIFFSDDFLIDSSDLNVKGQGQINFPNNFMDCQLQVQLQNVLTSIPIKTKLI